MQTKSRVRNGVDVIRLEETIGAIKADPGLADFRFRATYRVQLQTAERSDRLHRTQTLFLAAWYRRAEGHGLPVRQDADGVG